jgi:hypothetical protein
MDLPSGKIKKASHLSTAWTLFRERDTTIFKAHHHRCAFLDKTNPLVSPLLPMLPASNNKQIFVNWQEKFLGRGHRAEGKREA